MSRDALATLADVRGFLEASVLPAVPGNLRSEVRAAIKNLADATEELDVLPDLLVRETTHMVDLCRQGVGMLSPCTFGSLTSAEATARCNELATRIAVAETLRARIAVHADALDLAGTLLVALQRASRESASMGSRRDVLRTLIGDFHGSLQAQAASRLRWQSVFPSTGSAPSS